ncbi:MULTISPECIES: VOC family protein [unclassified Isoptericola]|uniref:VOC family protein n=1 Tax=unclassified Isoptericola TaxID=2623355 RepID=UPI00365D5FC2
MPTAARVTGVLTVAVPVRDQDAALEFYTSMLGMEVRFDAELQPGFRWIDIAPGGGGGASLSLVRAGDGLPSGVDTGIRLGTRDAGADHAALAAAGVDVGELLLWGSAPPMFTFRDPDGNLLYVTENAEG